MTPTDQTSTLEEILGGFLPTTKHSGGKYLQEENWVCAKLHINFHTAKTEQRQFWSMIWKQQLLSVFILSSQHCSEPMFSKHLQLYDTPHTQVTDSKSKTLNGNLQVLTSPTFNHISRRSHVIPRVRSILSHHNLHKNNNTTRPAIPWSQNADAWMAGKHLQKQNFTLMLVHEALQDPTNNSNISSASIQVLILDQAYTSKHKVLHGRSTFMCMQGSSCMCKISPSYG